MTHPKDNHFIFTQDVLRDKVMILLSVCLSVYSSHPYEYKKNQHSEVDFDQNKPLDERWKPEVKSQNLSIKCLHY